MNEKIKEILNTFKELTENYSESSLLDFEEYEIPCIQLKMILDYITNLQQENDKLNNKIKEQNLLLIEFQDMEQKLDIYKSRCEKAIEYIDEHTLFVSGGIIKSILNGGDEK